MQEKLVFFLVHLGLISVLLIPMEDAARAEPAFDGSMPESNVAVICDSGAATENAGDRLAVAFWENRADMFFFVCFV